MFARHVRDPVTRDETTVAEQAAVRHDICDFDDVVAVPGGDLVERATDASVLLAQDPRRQSHLRTLWRGAPALAPAVNH